jgi:hypothetical protein
MITIINKLLSYINLKLVSTKPDTSLVKETVKFLDTIPKDTLCGIEFFSTYVGDINYVQEKVKDEFPQVSGKTYIETEDKYYDYEGDTYTTEELQEKLR